MQVALTVDIEEHGAPAGADNPRRQLEVFSREGVPANFFVQGRWAAAYPALTRRIHADGHLIGNHTYHHAPLTMMTDEGISYTVNRADEVITPRAGIATTKPWFRCPYGDGEDDERVLGVLAGLGYRNVPWHVDPDDWRPDRTAEEVVEAVVIGCRERGDALTIVLMHSWPDVTLGALPLFIEDLRAEGATFVRLDQAGWP